MVMGIAQLRAVSLDCAEPKGLAEFYAELTGGRITYESADFVAIQGPAVWLTFQRVDEYREPTWPEGPVPQQLHLEFSVNDLEAAQEQALAAGARLPATQPSPDRWRVLLDPAGHPFCVTTLIPPD